MLFDVISLQGIEPEQAIIFCLIMLVIFAFSISIHEFAHAFAAYKMGDITPKVQGRLTLNPFKHLDNTGFFMFLFLGIGWAKPVPINPLNFKKYKTGIRIVSIAGILANIALGLISAGLYLLLITTIGAPTMAMQYVYFALDYAMIINSVLALFNLIPIYPLDGFNFITSFMKSNNKFIHFTIKNGFKILLTILLIDTIILLMFPLEMGIIDYYLRLIYDFILYPISHLGV